MSARADSNFLYTLIMAKTSVKQSAAANFDALFGARQGERAPSGTFKMLAPNRITVRPQVRKTFPRKNMDELRASIHDLREAGHGIEGTGILQTLLVTPVDDGYRLIFGEKRLRCGIEEQLPELPCLSVASVSEATIRLLQLAENSARTPAPILEEAAAICEAMDEQKLSIRNMARLLGKDKSHIEECVNLIKKYDTDIQNMVSARADSLRHARHIHKITDERLRQELIRAVIEDDISEREVQRRINSDGISDSSGANSNSSSSGTSTRSVSVGVGNSNTSDEKRDPLAQCLKPASSFAAEAARLLKGTHLSHEYRTELAAELSTLEKQIAKIRKLIE